MAFLKDRRGLGRVLAAALLAAVALAGPEAVRGHVGNRLRLGYRPEPLLVTLARLTEVYVEAVSGYVIDLKEYPDAASLQEAVRSQGVDIALECPAPAWVGACRAGETAPESLGTLLQTRFREDYGAVWVGAYDLRLNGREFAVPSYLLSRQVAGDLSFYTLPAYLKKLMAALTQEEVDGIMRRWPLGADRSSLSDFLSAKRML